MTASTAELREIIDAQQAELDRMCSAPQLVAQVLRVEDEALFVLSGGTLTKVPKPANKSLQFSEGQSILVMADTGQFIEHLYEPIGLGNLITLHNVDKKTNTADIESQGSVRKISLGLLTEAETGDRVILDNTSTVALVLFPAEKIEVVEHDPVTWDQIGGQEEAKQALHDTVELPLLHPDLYKAYNKKPIQGVLLFGPPGCGKTMLGRALSTSLGGGFQYIKGPELLNAYVGQTEANIRDIFARAKKYKMATGKPAVIFLDEADALLGVRGRDSIGMEKTVVPQFLTEMDGLEPSSAIVILATNRSDQLDPAVTREGRIDRKINVTRPDQPTVFTLFQLYLQATLVADGKYAELAKLATDCLFDDALTLMNVVTDGGVMQFNLQHIVSGALIASIVEQAANMAMHRDIKNGGKPTGIIDEDILQAVSKVYHQNHNLHHDEAIRDFAGPYRIKHLEKPHDVFVPEVSDPRGFGFAGGEEVQKA